MSFFSSPPPPPSVPEPLLIPGVFADTVVLQWAGSLMLLQIIVQTGLSFAGMPKLSQEAGLVAHQLCVLIAFVYAAYHGVRLTLYDEAISAMAAGTYVDRLYRFHPFTWVMTRFFLGFQMYDLCATALVPSLRKAEHIFHHVFSLLTACAGTSGPLLMYYCPFFFGVVELSSVPLALVDLLRIIDPAKGTVLGAVNEFVRIAFALSFLPLRCYMFPRFVFTVNSDLYAAHLSDDVRNPIALGWFALSSSVLCALQLFWGFKIVRILLKMLSGKEGDRKKEA